MTAPSPRLSVTTWSLHRALGLTYPDAPGQGRQEEGRETYGLGEVTLLDLPERVAALGFRTMEICHFHLPSRDRPYLEELRGALEAAGVRLLSLLIDDGDLTHAEHGTRDREWIGGWIDTAAALGAERARVIAGKAAYSPEAMARSVDALRELAARGKAQGVRVTTENWFALLSCPKHVHELLDRLEGAVGLNGDFGNWGGPTKYDDLEAIFSRAETSHAKAHFSAPGKIDRDDYVACLELTRRAGFTGPYTLVYDGPGRDEWHGLAIEAEVVRPYLAGA
jgi:sugar phosphate isomerase/epimerase